MSYIEDVIDHNEPPEQDNPQMTTEKKLSVTENGKYKNIDAYSLNNGEHFTATKKFAGARKIDMPAKGDRKPYSFFSAGVTYDGTDVSFIIKKQAEADAFDACGGIGDTVKVSLTKEIYTDTKGVDRVKKTLSFVKA